MKRAGTRPLFVALALASITPSIANAQWVDLAGTQPHALDTATPLAPASDCESCHARGDADPSSAFMPTDTWRGSMMANAVRDPLYLAALTVAEQDHAGIGDFCLRCHTPNAFIAGRTRVDAQSGFGRMPPLLASDGDGVTCDGCHRMIAPTTSAFGNGQYEYSPTDTRFGPYDDAMSMRHGTAQSTFTAESRLCGTCHGLSNPLVHRRAADGSDTGVAMPLDTTYAEWAASAFARAGDPAARTCQDCHMPRADGDLFVSTTGGVPRTMPRRHDFAGANVWGIGVVRDVRNDPSVSAHYDLAIERAHAMLASAARLTVMDAPASAMPGETAHVTVRFENLSGHKLPTGYADGRRVWLEVALVDASGAAQIVSGRYDDANAALDETDPQLHLYEALHGRIGTGVEEHLALHDTVVRDTRIPPREMTSNADIAPVGADFAGGANGTLRNDDVATYAIAIPSTASGSVTVRVRALYQSTTREYVEFLEHENHTDDRGTTLRAAWEASGRAAPIEMTTASRAITVAAMNVDAGTDAATDASIPGDAIGAEERNAQPSGCGCRVPAHEGHAPAGIAWIALAATAVTTIRRRTRHA